MSETTPEPKPRKRRRLHWHLSLWMLVMAVLATVFLVLVSMSLTGRVIVLPSWATEKVLDRMNREMAAGSVTLGRVEVGVTPKGRPRLRLVNVGIRDRTGLEVAQLNGIEGGIQPAALLQGRIEPSTIYLSGAQVTLRRRANGEFDLSFGEGAGASGNLASVLDTIDQAFSQGLLSRTEKVAAEDLTITLEDARSGRLWQVTDGRLQVTQTEKIVDITVAFDVFNQTEELAHTVLGFRSAKGSSAASFGATFQNAAAADIAAQSPALAFLSVIDAPISGALRTTIDEQGNIADLAGTLELGAGALSPTTGARPVGFSGAKVYLEFDPRKQRVNFSEVSVTSDVANVRGEAQIYLSDFNRGWPGSLVGQLKLTQAELNARDYFAGPVVLDRGAADFRLRLDPFTLELGQVMLGQRDRRYYASGEISAGRDGWSMALDARADEMGRDEVMALWPLPVAPQPRDWVAQFVTAGEVFGINAAIRLDPGQKMRVSVGARFRDATVRVIKELPPVERAMGYMVIDGDSFTMVSEQGFVTAPTGDVLDIAGTVYQVPDMKIKPAPARVDLHMAGQLAGGLSLLDGKPFDIFKDSEFGPDVATGNFRADGLIEIVLKQPMNPKDARYDITAELSGLRSDVLVRDHVLRATSATLHATHEALEITGDVRIGRAQAGGTWRQLMGDENRGRSRLEGWLGLDEAFVKEFGIGLPDGALTGQGIGQVSIDFENGRAPRFSLVSDLNRLGIDIASLGWSKPANRTGSLRAEGSLGASSEIETVEIDVPGLVASGRITTTAEGAFDEAVFDRVRIGGWLDAPVTFTGRGKGQDPVIAVLGGSMDLRRADFPSGQAVSSDAPIRLVLDRLTISEGIDLTSFSSNLSRRGGLNGTFSAFVNGGPAIKGVLAQQADGAAVRITSADGGEVLRAAGIFSSAQGGEMELILAPRPGEGVYEGELKIQDTRVAGASTLADLLAAVSVLGILEQLNGQGLSFGEVEARFRMTPENVTIYRSSAVGPSLGISMDGSYDLTNSRMDMQGVLSPIYLVNAIGQIFTRKGEGLIGFNFTLKGAPDDPEVVVNPLSLFTPAMFREIFRRAPPQPEE